MSLVASGGALRPCAANRTRIEWSYLVIIVTYHLLACLAFLPYFFSWSAVIVLIVGTLAFGTLGINICYHRLLCHQAFTCPRWFERSLAILGMCCAQQGPLRWVAVHRRHHQFSDEDPDPHTPLVSFLWAHVGWLVVEDRGLNRIGLYSRYAREMAQDRFYQRCDRNEWYLGLLLLMWVLFFLGGYLAALATGSTAAEALQFGAGILVWGVFVRTVVVWHITWSVNSVGHVWGAQRYDTGDTSRNNFIVGIISNGEGWHNNHHADPRTAKNSRVWWELDVSYYLIRLFGAVGLARNIVMPNPRAGKPIERAAKARVPEPAPGSS